MRQLTIRLTALLAVLACLAMAAPALADNTSAKKYPYSTIAQLNTVYECGCKRTGSGVMVGRRGLLTAAHLLICPYHSRWAKSIQFKFGIKNSRDCLYTYTGGYEMTVYDTFKQSNGTVKYDSKNDIGYVVFDKNVGNTTGWMGTYAPSDYDLSDERFHFMGYRSGTLTEDWMFVTPQKNNMFTFRRNPYDSLRGAPIFVWDEGAYPSVLGIYNSFSNSYSYARRITNKIIDDMRRDGAVE